MLALILRYTTVQLLNRVECWFSRYWLDVL